MIAFELGIIAGLLLAFWLIRRLTEGLRRERCLAVGASISLGFLYLRVAAGALIVDFGRDPVALLEHGLSLQNQIQAGVTVTAAIWAGYVLLSRRVPLAQILTGPQYWLVLLILSYVFSALWSPLPSLTIFRSFELAVFLVIATHAFGSLEADAIPGAMINLLLVLVGLMVLHGLLLPESLATTHIGFFGALRHNHGGLLAAMTVTLSVQQWLQTHRSRYFLIILIGFAALVAFGSFASILALICGLTVLLALSVPHYFRALAVGGTVLTGSLALFVMLAGLQAMPMSWLIDFARMFGKSDELLFTISGRVPYWQAVWSISLDRPFGLGFAAAERFLGVDLELPGIITNAHSGYVSAWLGSGWLGLGLCLAIFAAVISRSAEFPHSWRAAHLALVTVLAVNNITLVSVGGPINAGFLVLMALAALPGEAIRSSVGGRGPILRPRPRDPELVARDLR